VGPEEVQALLPHRHPFLFVDFVDIIEPARKAVGVKCVTVREDFFQGHFPGRPLMPGVLILEALAQTAGVLLKASGAIGDKLAFFIGIDDAKFRRPVTPGSSLELHIEVLKLGGRAGRIRGEARLGGECAAEATMTFALADR
jgi:3-hydroxyacyl-[acyl-carrier-protein] dehydratase